MKLWRAYLRQHRLTVLMLVLFTGLFAVSFALYGLPLAAVAYPAGLCALAGAGMAVWDFRRAARRHKEMEQLRQTGETVLAPLPEMKTVEGRDCAALVEQLRQELRRQLDAAETRRGETVAYYTAWVHQIKTPIAAMRLTLQGEDTPAARRLTAELGRIEQYVDMVLTYLRLEEGGSDYVIRPCSVDEVVRAAVRRFAGEFIDRRIRLDYEPVQWETVTDGKWLTFVVEQLLSNALKYTGQEGVIRIYRQGDELCIADTGIGIAPEDLPRVFQMGYTGQNGRLDRRSSGIGLYLCRRICGNLRHGIRMESVPGKGTTVYLTLGRGDFLPEWKVTELFVFGKANRWIGAARRTIMALLIRRSSDYEYSGSKRAAEGVYHAVRRQPGRGAAQRELHCGAGRVCGHYGRVRQRQDHAFEHSGGSG